ncbi:Riboflavin synthase [Phycisphaerae bacterium RAS1]|nr:Riboflavin synthase [Phycisphaerae bacterium RAS1]
MARRTERQVVWRLLVFSGIVEAVAPIVAVRGTPAGHRLDLRLGELLDELTLGASIAINGCCLTLAAARGGVGGFDVVPETWRLTNLKDLGSGARVNVERSLRIGDRIDGHFVQGHVDALGTVERVERAGAEWKLWIAAPHDVMRLVARKGSIAVDGVSLTVVDVDDSRFSVALIPTTLERTVLGARRAGDRVNLETDLVARTVVRWLETAHTDESARPSRVTLQRLREAGFVA